ncbi:tail fiber domain-containing protein [Subsaxibacter sp. CAU 1640]|uniref:tail fiber domain-containing protein n=1 Tax=Subsaxibacter sp. CAU 1640 TaxID=2933271 RepID=UPI0020064ECF|nr:tail fiber domain-containing protein [Subsaxibacter sp. CAU 1640]MCK7590761.1 tail fiber domain-containing protein [Subsaxibacter sp. CAU 1640]
MKSSIIIATFFLISIQYLNAQIGIGTTSPNAKLDVRSSNQITPSNNDGLLIPKINNFPATPPTAAQDGMLVFVTGNGTPAKGFYYWDQPTTSWIPFKGVEKIDDLLDGKSDNDGTNNGSSIFLGIGAGAYDASDDLRNIGIGYNALNNNDYGANNIAIGHSSLANSIGGQFKIAIGNNTLQNNNGYSNIAIGVDAMSNTSNNVGNNVAIGTGALNQTTGLTPNIAIGSNAMYNNTGGGNNVALGEEALSANLLGSSNVAIGRRSLHSNIHGLYNIGIGPGTLSDKTTGNHNIGIGYLAIGNLISGGANTVIGSLALYENTGGENNTVIGYSSGRSNIIGSGNIFLGTNAAYNELGSNKLYIENSNADSNNALIYGEFDNNMLRVNGNLQVGGEANLNRNIATGVALRVNGSEAIWYNGTYFSWGFGGIGNFFSDNVGIGVTNTPYQLQLSGNSAAKPTSSAWTVASDARLKTNVREFTDGLNLIDKINPVWFTYNGKAGMPNETGVGTIAQELQKVAPYMVNEWTYQSEDGSTKENYLSVDYGAMDFVLINAIKEQQKIIEQQNAKIEALERRLDSLERTNN